MDDVFLEEYVITFYFKNKKNFINLNSYLKKGRDE